MKTVPLTVLDDSDIEILRSGKQLPINGDVVLAFAPGETPRKPGTKMEQPKRCRYCHREFPSPASVRMHLNRVHSRTVITKSEKKRAKG